MKKEYDDKVMRDAVKGWEYIRDTSGYSGGRFIKALIEKGIKNVLDGKESEHNWIKKSGNKVIFDTGTYKSRDGWESDIIDDFIERNSFEAINDWATKLKQDQALIEEIKCVIRYYDFSKSPYFQTIRNLFKEKGFITEAQYNKLCKNKFATKVYEAHMTPAQFNTGAIVSLRATHSQTSQDGYNVFKRAPNGVLVLSNSEPIISACKGAKRYKVVAIGDSEPFYIEERYLKKKKMNKKKT